jgi:hypothetical protein
MAHSARLPLKPWVELASSVIRLAAISILCLAAPLAAAQPVAVPKQHGVHCAHKRAEVAATAWRKTAAPRPLASVGGPAGGGFAPWGRIVGDLMP